MRKRRLLTVMTLLTALFVGGAITATPAYAAFECPSSAVCVWDWSDGTGDRYYWSKSTILADSDLYIPVAGAWNDRASSARNNLGTHGVTFYEHVWSCGGAVLYLPPAHITYGMGGYLSNKVSCFHIWPA